MTEPGRAFLLLHPDDNVATLIDDRAEQTRLSDGKAIEPGIAFGHKFAICRIPQGAPVIKYGVQIGLSLADIEPGQHVHVHNCR